MIAASWCCFDGDQGNLDDATRVSQYSDKHTELGTVVGNWSLDKVVNFGEDRTMDLVGVGAGGW